MKGLLNYLKSNKHKMTYLVSIEKFLDEHMWELYCDMDDVEIDKFSIDA